MLGDNHVRRDVDDFGMGMQDILGLRRVDVDAACWRTI
jgi:hypothetical protein